MDQRLRLKPLTTPLNEPIPGGASWNYVFGSATLFLFGLQFDRHKLDAVHARHRSRIRHRPIHSAGSLGWMVLSEACIIGELGIMVAIGLHMLQVFFDGVQPPRDVDHRSDALGTHAGIWLTGYLLPWDQNAYWATQVGINMVGAVPLIGDFYCPSVTGR
ncbi:MAG: cytochrome b N-terminal domain-containing protein [Nitrospirales bacterium]|nr:cytochrome b N-terminal domain-containing protein [Nitrospirales bacterium]